jgi:hypothetical protein
MIKVKSANELVLLLLLQCERFVSDQNATHHQAMRAPHFSVQITVLRVPYLKKKYHPSLRRQILE